MSSDTVIQVSNIRKTFAIYDKPIDRLKQMLFGRFGKKYFTEFHALKDISFEVKRGECVGIVGRNGAGKSTLLQIITGTLQPSSGVVAVNGRVAALLELGSGFNMEFTGRENVYMNASILGLSRDEINAKYQAIIDFADIGDFIDQPVKTYSTGMLLRLAFAVIAHVDADILIVDEALAVGDAFFQQKCMRFIRKFKEEHTILFVSHDTQSVVALCERAIYLDKGNVCQDGSAKEVIEHYLQNLYSANQDVQGAQQETDSNSETSDDDDFEDMRQPYLRCSNLRNDIEVFRFVPPENGSSCFGAGGANITSVQFLNSEGKPLSWIIGGEIVNLRIVVALERDCFSPIVGFTIKNRLGEDLFVDNTYLKMRDTPLDCRAGETLQADFVFRIPVLPPGQYTVSPAIAVGTMENHTQLQWIYDALVFESHASSSLGLVGLNMRRIDLKKL
jgi:lipopolysaccharide transport system ATP-binding protein